MAKESQLTFEFTCTKNREQKTITLDCCRGRSIGAVNPGIKMDEETGGLLQSTKARLLITTNLACCLWIDTSIHEKR
jgi:hypothetical protein